MAARSAAVSSSAATGLEESVGVLGVDEWCVARGLVRRDAGVVVVVVVRDVMGDVATVCVGTRSRFRISATMDAWPRMARS